MTPESPRMCRPHSRQQRTWLLRMRKADVAHRRDTVGVRLSRDCARFMTPLVTP